MKYLTTALLILSLASCSKRLSQAFVASDIDHFWQAYDMITQTNDTILQQQYLDNFFIGKATAGQLEIMEARNYTSAGYLQAINSYPLFWNSIRANTQKYLSQQKEITRNIQKLKKAYPDLKPSTIYFTIGVLRTNGTTMGNHVLIGNELAFGDDNTIINELPEWRQPFFQTFKPLENLGLLCTHEYLHTQQKEMVHNLLSICLYEGIAEYISCKVTGKKSSTPSIQFGKDNVDIVVSQFVQDLYLIDNNFNWLWGENRNQLKVRDLGYFIGYEIAERYYNQAADKRKVIKDLIELDYNNESAVESLVDASGLLPKPLLEIFNEYESSRPVVVNISEFENGSKMVSPTTKRVTVNFSEALNGHNTGLDFGPLGQDFYPKVDNNTRQWSSDNQSYSFEVALIPKQRYQMVISNFRRTDGIRLKSFLIDFETDSLATD